MHSNIRLVISFAIARIGCLATALLVLPAAAGTNSWTAIGLVTYPFAVAVDPSSPSTIYSVTGVNGNTVTKTTDGGGHWVDLADFPLYPVNSVVIDRRSPATIYVAGGDPWDVGWPIFKSIDGGTHWAAASNDGPVSVLAIAPSLSSTLYAGENHTVFKSIDGGLSWAMRSGGLTGFYVSSLAIDPTNADVVYIAQQVAAILGPRHGEDLQVDRRRRAMAAGPDSCPCWSGHMVSRNRSRDTIHRLCCVRLRQCG